MLRGECPARWEPQEEVVMSIAAGFPSVKKPRFIVQERKAHNVTEGDACYFAIASDNLYMAPHPSFAC
jgi:hypothetical protein